MWPRLFILQIAPPLSSRGLLWSWHSPHHLQPPAHLCALPRGPVLRVTGPESQGHCLQGLDLASLLNPNPKAQSLPLMRARGLTRRGLTANVHHKVSQSLSLRLAAPEGPSAPCHFNGCQGLCCKAASWARNFFWEPSQWVLECNRGLPLVEQ